jgi:serine/threonine-protein kinase
VEAQAVKATIEDGPCPYCGDHVGPDAAPGTACPFRHEPSCPVLLAESSVDLGGDFYDETVAYRDDTTMAPGGSGEPSDGFPAADDLPGTELGLYRIDERIGRGSMGRVYRGEHLGLGRTSAVKVLSPGLVARQPQMVERFRGEARAVAGLAHPNIVTVHNIGHDRGYHYIEMEYVPGGHSLKQGVVRDGAFDAIRATVLVRQVALGLAAAHRGGLVHRDVKPANVLLTPEGTAKLADFGLVRKLAEIDSAGGPLAGTPTFMAPELFAGAPPSARTDLYAVGVMFFYLLTARLPFASEHLGQLIRMHRRTPAPDPRRLAPEVPDELVPIVLRLLAKDPAERHASADELADELKVVSAHLRDTESLVHEALEGFDGLIQQGARDAFRVIVPVPGDRLQEVYIEAVEGKHRERLLSVYSVCAPAEPRNYEFALKLNARLTYGSLSIREVGDSPMFVMTRTFARGHVNAADLRAAVAEIARRGDWVEQQLTSTDLF